jgi:hypothetical protein
LNGSSGVCWLKQVEELRPNESFTELQMSWLCHCGVLNASANLSCAGFQYYRKREHFQISASGYDSSSYWTHERRLKHLNENEQLFAKFYNEERLLVIDMADDILEEHIIQYELIAREAKARLTAAAEEKRDRRAKKGSKGEWQIAPSGPDQSVTDTINKVKIRANKMSKLDKLRDSLTGLGLSDHEIDQMVSKMVAQARKDKPSATPVNTGMAIPKGTKAIVNAEADAKEKAEAKALKETQPLVDGLIQPIDEPVFTTKKVEVIEATQIFPKRATSGLFAPKKLK